MKLFGVVAIGLMGCSGPQGRADGASAGSGATGGLPAVSGGSAGATGGQPVGTGASSSGGAGGAQSGAGSAQGGAGSAQGGAAGSIDADSGGVGGSALPDSCFGVTCNTPPASDCTSASQLEAYDTTGACVDGACSYPSHVIECACHNGACSVDPCLSLTCASPPIPSCQSPSTLTTYAALGSCEAGSCSYQANESACSFGCDAGACKPDPCDAVTCNQPPAAICKSATVKTSYAPSGVCAGAVCSYAAIDTACDFGCAQGACKPDPCSGVSCEQPPATSCTSGSELKTYDQIGSCVEGLCKYTSHLAACTCQAGACNSDPCFGVTCASPPSASCKDPSTRTTYASSGSCSAGACSYPAQDTACVFGCVDGACKPDPCASVTCTAPPPAVCKNPSTLTTYAASGTCSAGDCGYVPQDTACAFGCANGACKADPCALVSCDSPPAAICHDANTRTTFAAGQCSAGTCSYMASNTTCAFGCDDGACLADPCAGVTCNQPPAATCKSASTKTTYSGACSQGSCHYTPVDTACASNQTCGGAGVCAVCKTDASCGAACAACSGSTPRCKDQGATSQCVACVSDGDCGGLKPKCNTAIGVCEPQPSCVGLAKTCGPNGDQDCCSAHTVTGGTFNRFNDENAPATVSNFRLDDYEITVGRFRKFVAVYQKDIIPRGAGKNPNGLPSAGWRWSDDLPRDQAALKSALKCDAARQTWTDNAGSAAAESLPINCIDWYQAFAFCIWDGGRLPTQAESNYAAVGGSQQTVYPWGSTAPDCSYANFFGAMAGSAYCVAPGTGGLARVGSYSVKGDGPFGQSDLAGNADEWVEDYSYSIPPNPCVDCVQYTPSATRVLKGGSFGSVAPSLLNAVQYGSDYPNVHKSFHGARCVRIP
ncbi:MAG TPA: SUMF1/EgtB/PvdO family nonheme iron enzyme [Polyangiaceae bacterium]|nr:SUMF1/EgtB/PvdO family nonheme iron enzyme [Polyangiaceae bacterium]